MLKKAYPGKKASIKDADILNYKVKDEALFKLKAHMNIKYSDDVEGQKAHGKIKAENRTYLSAVAERVAWSLKD